jgi:hypothetical protein
MGILRAVERKDSDVEGRVAVGLVQSMLGELL